jgi:hypothetical protein
MSSNIEWLFRMKHKIISHFIKSYLILIVCYTISPVYALNPDAELVNQQTDLSVRNSKLYITQSYELKINNRLGEEYTEISIPYSKMSKVSKIEAYLKDKDGLIVKKLKSGDIKDRSMFSDGAFYDDNFVKEFTLKHNVYPYTFFYSYQFQETEFLSLDHWIPVIDFDIPTVNATLTLDVPRDYKFFYSAHHIDSLKTDTIENRLKYRWRASFNKQIESEILSPDMGTCFPKIVIVPDKFKFDKEGSFGSWKSYGNWEASLLDGLSDLPDEEKQHINSLITGVSNDKDKIKLLYHYLQDATRYINISIKTGGMKPYPASYVAINKYGDCKGLTNYFKSVLKYIGIPSFYTNVESGDLIKKIDMNFPSMQFDHVILCVPLKNDTLWLDCTSKGPFNHLGTFTQNRQVFLIDKENSHFIQTPALSMNEVIETRSIHFSSETDNEMKARFHIVVKGESFEQLSGFLRSVSETKKSQYIREYFIEPGFDLIDYNIIPADRDSTFITLNYTAKADKLFKKYGNEVLIRLVPFTIPTFKDPKNRKNPVQLNFPVNQQDSIIYQIPVGCQLSLLPKDQCINSSFGNYSIRFQLKNNKVEVFKSFVLNAGDYPVSIYKDFYKFIKTVYDIENSTYIVTKKQDRS